MVRFAPSFIAKAGEHLSPICRPSRRPFIVMSELAADARAVCCDQVTILLPVEPYCTHAYPRKTIGTVRRDHQLNRQGGGAGV